MLYFTHHDMLISGICTALPKNKICSSDFKERFGDQLVDDNLKKFGYLSSRISIPEQTASDLGFEAAKYIVGTKNIDPEEIGFIVTVTRTPDYRSPATSTVLHYRLGLNKDCICYDMNIGGTGFILGLNTGLALLDTINKNYGLLIIGDTTSKLIDKQDTRSMQFSDGASAVLLKKMPGLGSRCNVSTAANGQYFQTIINPGGAFRNFQPIDSEMPLHCDNLHSKDKLVIDEAELLKFATRVIPEAINEHLSTNKKRLLDFDLLGIHQESREIIELISKNLDFNAQALTRILDKYGNTVGNSIPLLLTENYGSSAEGDIDVLVCGYGEGLSWGVADFVINTSNIFSIIETDNYFSEAIVSHDF